MSMKANAEFGFSLPLALAGEGVFLARYGLFGGISSPDEVRAQHRNCDHTRDRRADDHRCRRSWGVAQ